MKSLIVALFLTMTATAACEIPLSAQQNSAFASFGAPVSGRARYVRIFARHFAESDRTWLCADEILIL